MEEETKNKVGRPSIYTEELAEIICNRIANGESVRTIEKDEDMPSGVTIYNWLLDESKKLFFKQYAKAREIQAENLFEEINELADMSVNDIVGDDKSDGARVQARKLQVDARKWYLSKVRPQKYGDKMDITSGDKPIPIINVYTNNGNKEDTEPIKEDSCDTGGNICVQDDKHTDLSDSSIPIG